MIIINNTTDSVSTANVNIYTSSSVITIEDVTSDTTAFSTKTCIKYYVHDTKLKPIDYFNAIEKYEFIHRNDVKRQNVFREGFVVSKIKSEFSLIENNKYVRKILRCDRKGIGLRIRRDA